MTQSVTYFEVQSTSIKPGENKWINATEYGELFQSLERAVTYISREQSRNYDCKFRVLEITVTKVVAFEA